MATMPCDNITCINRIDRDAYMKCQNAIKEETGAYGIVACGNCTPAPEGHWLHKLNKMGTEEMCDLLLSEQDCE